MTLLRRLAAWLGVISPLAYAYPAVDMQLPGDRHLHLVGSIHMGSVEMSPLPDALLQRLQGATALIVEADISDTGSPFDDNHQASPLAERLGAESYRQLQQISAALSLAIEQIDTLPAWQAALMLQARQAQKLGLRPDYGIDYQLIQAARAQNITIIELEGQQAQIRLLQQLPQDGIALLEDTLTHWHVNARLLQSMMGWWLENAPGTSMPEIPMTFSNDLSDRLMRQRNQHWQQRLQALPPGNYVVAVGALHIYGADSLPRLLQLSR